MPIETWQLNAVYNLDSILNSWGDDYEDITGKIDKYEYGLWHNSIV